MTVVQEKAGTAAHREYALEAQQVELLAQQLRNLPPLARAARVAMTAPQSSVLVRRNAWPQSRGCPAAHRQRHWRQ